MSNTKQFKTTFNLNEYAQLGKLCVDEAYAKSKHLIVKT